MRHPFEDADEHTRVFYSKVFYSVILNLNAVQLGYYNILLCETDDPMAGVKWREAAPRVVAAMRRRGQDGPPEEHRGA